MALLRGDRAATTSWASPSIASWLEIAAPWREQCAMRMGPRSRKVRRFHQLPYRAQSWSRSRKIIARVEATEMGTDARFIVTNLEGRGKTLYEKVYCARGAAENLIKDMKLYTRSDKTACSRWQANQFRLFLHMGAYWLLHSLRRAAPRRSMLARRHLRDHPARVREDRGAHRGDQEPHQTRVPGQLSPPRHADRHHRQHHCPRPVTGAAQ